MWAGTIGGRIALLAIFLLACGGPAAAPLPDDPLVWRLGVPCDLDRPQDCGPEPLSCGVVLTERKIAFCTMPCSASSPCSAGAVCLEDLGLCSKECAAAADCAPGAVCNAGGHCMPDCRIEPQMCHGELRCRSTGLCD